MKIDNEYFRIINYNNFYFGIKKGTIISISNVKSEKFRWKKKSIYYDLYFNEFCITILADNGIEKVLPKLERRLNERR